MSPSSIQPHTEPPSLVWTPERQAIARREAEEWRGTPHRDRLRWKQRGVDCVNFTLAMIIACGIAPDFELPYYDHKWGLGRENNILENLANKCFHVREVSDYEPYAFGDLCIFKVGRQSNHIGIVIDDVLWHCMTFRSVEPVAIDQKMASRFQCVVRLEKDGIRFSPEQLTSEDFFSS